MIRSLIHSRIGSVVAATAVLLMSSWARAQGIPVYDAQNVVQAIATVGQLKDEVQQEMQLYQSLSGTRGFGEPRSSGASVHAAA